MSDWIALTASDFSEMLFGPQHENLAARPHQGTALDPLTLALADAASSARNAIAANPLNMLSANAALIPVELRSCTLALALAALCVRWPRFTISEEQQALVDNAAETLALVQKGELPLSLPAQPQAQDATRRSPGVNLLQSRYQPLNANRLRGL